MRHPRRALDPHRVSDEVRPGYSSIRYIVNVASPASAENIARWLDTADRYSSWRDNLAGIVADVVIDVAVGTRSGVPAGPDAIRLATLVDTLPRLRLRGMLSYDGAAQHVNGFAARRERARGQSPTSG